MRSGDRAARERRRLAAGEIAVANGGLGREIVEMVALGERDDAAAESGPGQTGAQRTRADEDVDERVELGDGHVVVVSQAGVALDEKGTEGTNVVAAQCPREFLDAAVLRHDMSGPRAVRDLFRRGITQG